MPQKFKRSFLAILSLLLLTQSALGQTGRPKLIVTIVIDQFRADYLTRFESKFLPAIAKNGELGGFKYLMAEGAYYPFGQYDILQCMTGPGHATILSGSYPYSAGIPVNDWFDPKLEKLVYCVEDPTYPLVGVETTKPSQGRSPNTLIATTVGDELKSSGASSRVVSVSLKDRSAIFLGGHAADIAIWHDSAQNRWISSKYYLPQGELPPWLIEYNKTNSIDSKLLGTSEGVVFTEKLAEAALKNYQLGKGSSTDLFAVSFSSHDILGHAVGPNAPSMEALTLAEDQSLSKFLNFLNKTIPGGLSQVALAFTGDHGAPPVPEWAKTLGIKAGRIDDHELGRLLSVHLEKKFGPTSSGNWILNTNELNFYFNHALIQSRKIPLADIEAEAKQFLTQTPGIAFAFSYSDYQNRHLPPGMYEREILHTYYPGRSGDLVLIPKPYFMTGKLDYASNHLTGYSYDRTVPIVLAGYHIKPGIYSNRAEVIDIAPTLSYLAGILPPSLSEGRVLSEALLPERTSPELKQNPRSPKISKGANESK